jgi:ADP-ribosylglycohydrolase
MDGFHAGPGTRRAGEYTGAVQATIHKLMFLADGWEATREGLSKHLLAKANVADRAWPQELTDAENPKLSRSGNVGLYMIPVGIMSVIKDMDEVGLLTACRALCLTHALRRSILAGFCSAYVVRECMKNNAELKDPNAFYMMDGSLLSRLIAICKDVEEKKLSEEEGWPTRDALWMRLRQVQDKLQSNSSIEEVIGIMGNGEHWSQSIPFSIFCFMRTPTSYKTMLDVASAGGAASLNAALVGAFMGSLIGPAIIPNVLKDVENGTKLMEAGREIVNRLET